MNAIILSGGKGSRLGGKEKAFLKLGSDTFIGRKIKILKPFFEEIIVVTNNPKLYAGLKVKIVKDEKESVGPLMGLYCGLKGSSADLNFVTTPDTPFLKPEIIRYLIKNVDDYDAIVPRWDGMAEPLCAVYSKKCIPYIKKAMSGNRRINSFYEFSKVKFIPECELKKIDPQGISFFNVNTPSDYREARGKKLWLKV
jgi:molybdopterin-guanine dinucleotide biosynthesis protein A